MSDKGIDIIVAAGGDGTISDVMQGVLGTDSALAILPMGTGNDFARTLGLLDLDGAIDAIASGTIKAIDVGQWRQAGKQGHFLNVAGCGFDACVAERVNTGFRCLHGQAAYAAAILQVLRSYRSLQLSIEVDGERMEQKAMLCAIANAQSYGGGIRVAPTASLTDGLLDLVLVGDLGRLEFLKSFPQVLRGSHLKHPKVFHRRFRDLKLSSSPPSPILMDGELLPTGEVEIQVLPLALRIIVPDS